MIICSQDPLRQAKVPAIVHPRKPDRQHSVSLEHVQPSLLRKLNGMVRWAHRKVLFPQLICDKFYQKLKRLEGPGAEREYLRVVNLIHHVSWSAILAAMALLLEQKSQTLFENARDLLLGARRPACVIDITHPLHQSLTPRPINDYDGLIPGNEPHGTPSPDCQLKETAPEHGSRTIL